MKNHPKGLREEEKEKYLEDLRQRLAKAVQAKDRAMERAAQAHNVLGAAEERVCAIQAMINSITKAESSPGPGGRG